VITDGAAGFRPTEGVLEFRQQDGRLRTRPVAISLNDDLAYWTIQTNNEPIVQSESGSSLLVAGTRVGILMSVDPETRTGRVLKLTAAEPVFQQFFSEGNQRDEDRRKLNQLLVDFEQAYSRRDEDALLRLWRIDKRDLRNMFSRYGSGRLQLRCGPLELGAHTASRTCSVTVLRAASGGPIGAQPLDAARTFVFNKQADGHWQVSAIR
jgi:hypothetical protein